MHDLSFMHIFGQRMEVPGAIIIDGMYLMVDTYTTSALLPIMSK